MKAIVFDEPGDADVLYLGETEDLEHGPTELLVQVHATAVNRADTLQRRGFYPPPAGASEVLGLEMAGEIIAVGAEVKHWQVGDRVCALLAGGGYAEQVVIPAGLALKIPDSLSYAEAAGLPEVWLTAFDNIFNWGRLQPGETLLIHGGGSGVGTAAIQLAKSYGCEVLITAGSQEKIDRCVELGAKAGINYRTEEWHERALELTAGRGVDVILDIIGGSYLERNLECLAFEGRLVIIATMGGPIADLDIRTLMRKRLSLCGTTLRARPIEAKIALTEQFRRTVWPRFAKGELKPVIDQTFPLAEAAQAHALMESSEHFGKIILEL